MSKDANVARYMGKMEEATEKLFNLEEFKAKHGAEGKPLEDLKEKYAKDIVTYGNLVGYLTK